MQQMCWKHIVISTNVSYLCEDMNMCLDAMSVSVVA
jgi:hypothetical protein